jgi:hypothetical protein
LCDIWIVRKLTERFRIARLWIFVSFVFAVAGRVLKEKDFYYATGSLKDMAKILSYLQGKCI